jgi:hypothetical protein
MDEASTRRRVLAGVCVAGVGSVAGCLTGGDGSGDDGTDADADDDGSGDAADGGGTTEDAGMTGGAGTTEAAGTDAESTGSAGGATSADDLDLREANVVGVELASGSDGTRFSVTLIHDDDGEDGYANWWVVETRDGEELGRRDLAHAHGTREFTRSETVSVPGDVECVVVRGHDQTHEYGGQAAVVSMPSGATRFVRQGRATSSFADADCP